MQLWAIHRQADRQIDRETETGRQACVCVCGGGKCKMLMCKDGNTRYRSVSLSLTHTYTCTNPIECVMKSSQPCEGADYWVSGGSAGSHTAEFSSSTGKREPGWFQLPLLSSNPLKEASLINERWIISWDIIHQVDSQPSGSRNYRVFLDTLRCFHAGYVAVVKYRGRSRMFPVFQSCGDPAWALGTWE